MNPIHATIPTTGETRALLAAYRRQFEIDVDAMAAELTDEEPDAALLDVVSAPFSSVSDVADRLMRTESYFRDRGDRRAVFLTVYRRMTGAVQSAIDAGAFTDAEWAATYLVAFANHYRRALIAFERRAFGSLPRPWLIGFVAGARGETLVAQDALLGINAHINYDLTYTLAEIGIDPDRDAKRDDHIRINDILARLVQTVQNALVETYGAVGIAGIDELLDPLDDRLALLGLKGSREFAWRNAVLLADLPAWAAERYVDWRTRTVSTGAAALVLAPRADADTRRLLRDAEDGAETMSRFHEELQRGASPSSFDDV